MNDCIHYTGDERHKCRIIEDEWFEECHRLYEDCPAYKTVEQEIESELKVRDRAEAKMNAPYECRIPRHMLMEYIKSRDDLKMKKRRKHGRT